MLVWCLEREAVNNCQFQIGPPTSIYQTQLFEAFKDPTTNAWRLWHHIFHPHRSGALENITCLHSIITTCHPSYLCIWGNICHVQLDPRLPLFLMYVEKIRETGDEVNVFNKLILSLFYFWLHNYCYIYWLSCLLSFMSVFKSSLLGGMCQRFIWMLFMVKTPIFDSELRT